MVYPHSYRTEHSETKTTNSIYGEYYARMKSKKIKIQPELLTILRYVDSNRERFVDEVAEAIAIKSISGNLDYLDTVTKMTKFAERWLRKLDIKYECFKMGQQVIDGKQVQLPSAILASIGKDKDKPTVLIYCYLDVQENEKWVTDPWTLTMKNNCYYGAGVASGKGTFMAWLHVVQAFLDSKIDLPVNIKFIVEAMFHHDSMGMAAFLATRKQDFLANVDYIIVCEGEWLGEKYPAVIYGTIGLLHYDVTMEKNGDSDMRADMEALFKQVQDEEGNVTIPHFHDIVRQITPEEEMIYEHIKDFNIEEVRKTLPPHMQSWDQVRLLMRYWRLPSIYVDDIQECECENKDEMILKRHVIIKIVPKQIIDRSQALVCQHLSETLPKQLGIKHKVTCEMVSSNRYWYENITSPLFQAARRATIQIYKEDPNMIREDKTRSILTIFDRTIERDIVLIPLANKGSNCGGGNESMTKKNFFESRKLLGALLFQIAKPILA